MTRSTTRIDFYLLAQGQEAQRLELACRLTEKAWHHGYHVCIQTADDALATRLDKLLWAFKEESFIPHAKAPGNGEPVLIYTPEHALPKPSNTDSEHLLIQLADTLPEQWQHFARIAEIVSDEPSVKQANRAHYRQYQSQGHTPHVHHLRG